MAAREAHGTDNQTRIDLPTYVRRPADDGGAAYLGVTLEASLPAE